MSAIYLPHGQLEKLPCWILWLMMRLEYPETWHKKTLMLGRNEQLNWGGQSRAEDISLDGQMDWEVDREQHEVDKSMTQMKSWTWRIWKCATFYTLSTKYVDFSFFKVCNKTIASICSYLVQSFCYLTILFVMVSWRLEECWNFDFYISHSFQSIASHLAVVFSNVQVWYGLLSAWE